MSCGDDDAENVRAGETFDRSTATVPYDDGFYDRPTARYTTATALPCRRTGRSACTFRMLLSAVSFRCVVEFAAGRWMPAAHARNAASKATISRTQNTLGRSVGRSGKSPSRNERAGERRDPRRQLRPPGRVGLFGVMMENRW